MGDLRRPVRIAGNMDEEGGEGGEGGGGGEDLYS